MIAIQRGHMVWKSLTNFDFHLASLHESVTTVFLSLLFRAFCSIQLFCAISVFKIIKSIDIFPFL